MEIIKNKRALKAGIILDLSNHQNSPKFAALLQKKIM